MRTPAPRPDVQPVLDFLATQPAPSWATQTPAEAREAMLASLPATDLPVGDIATMRELVIPTSAGPLPGLLLDARRERPRGPALIWYHGGGFVTGGIDTHRSFAADLARRLDLPVILADYRLAPEAPFPAAVDDAEAVARWVADNPAELGLELDAIVLGGDSAGGTLSIVTAMALRDQPAAVPVRSQLVVYPATDLTREYPSQRLFADGYLLTADTLAWYYGHYAPVRDDVRASPLLGRHDGLPPTVVLTAGLDPCRDEGRAFAQELIAAGVPTIYLEAQGHVHAFVLLRGAVPSTSDDIGHAITALRAFSGLEAC